MALEATAKPVEVTEDFEEKNSSDSEEKEKEKKEVIFAEDVERIFGKRPWTSRSEEIMALEATAKPVEGGKRHTHYNIRTRV